MSAQQGGGSDDEPRMTLRAESSGVDGPERVQGSVLDEPKIRAALKQGDFSRWQRPGGYALQEDLTAGEPARILMFQVDHRWYVGYKTLSDYFVYHDVSGILCSRIYWHNVVGHLDGIRISDTEVRVAFRPFGIDERHAVFDAIASTTAITHPFVNHSERGQEEASEPDGWPVTEERAQSLNVAEEHLRRYTRTLFAPTLANLAEDVTVYDPACSTGHFLAEFADIAPARIRTVGQDLSRPMTELAKTRIEEVHHGDARRPAPEAGTVDILFSRFLNSEVVTTQSARGILPRLVSTLQPGGLMVLLGHSPVLLDVPDLQAAGLSVLQTTGRQDDYVFQYYVCRKSI
ncbi:class I SAM-dependent methyltransferase [Streptomyces sp. RKND-216]|uniref:class I SAM-dependent methyltransferase n=1 Tax=Streptomyces sp. RKND-216 TaxID=2562581 RepID=UPI00109DB6CC|nr:class I SAM-dependent methyltransferase [Streptomyces sp. RKND-216]THA24213.1 class I SAM-dependent methyltransferase [Streptomyces sp. RKND-216]